MSRNIKRGKAVESDKYIKEKYIEIKKKSTEIKITKKKRIFSYLEQKGH